MRWFFCPCSCRVRVETYPAKQREDGTYIRLRLRGLCCQNSTDNAGGEVGGRWKLCTYRDKNHVTPSFLASRLLGSSDACRLPFFVYVHPPFFKPGADGSPTSGVPGQAEGGGGPGDRAGVLVAGGAGERVGGRLRQIAHAPALHHGNVGKVHRGCVCFCVGIPSYSGSGPTSMRCRNNRARVLAWFLAALRVSQESISRRACGLKSGFRPAPSPGSSRLPTARPRFGWCAS